MEEITGLIDLNIFHCPIAFRGKGGGGADLAHPEGWVPRAPADPTEAPGPAQDEDALGSPSPCGGAAHAAPSGLRAGGAL